MIVWITLSSLHLYVVVVHALSPWFGELVRTSPEELKRIIHF